MSDASTVALNLVFLGTVVLGFLMFLGGLALFSIVLITAGAGRVAASLVTGVARWTRNRWTLPPPHRSTGSAPPDQERTPTPHP